METQETTVEPPAAGRLRRDLSGPAAVMMGLGAMLGTGVFVSIGVAAGVAGPAVLTAIFLAGLVALCNALSSAQLAADHPVSGGTYEYGYLHLTPWLGFSAGWMFLIAKSASAASAALGFSAYLMALTGTEDLPPAAVAVPLVLAVCALVLCGAKRSGQVNTVIVSATVLALLVFAALALPAAWSGPAFALEQLIPSDCGELVALSQACALMFVAFTGYGRIATMGEEVRNPRVTIPGAILTTIALTTLLYLLVGFACLAVPDGTSPEQAPLECALRSLGHGQAAALVSLGALTAMAGVLLNLVLGLSRVLLAMGRRGDAPQALARVDAQGQAPRAAVLTAGAGIAVLCLSGNIRLTWSFSAFTVLIYYAITNLAALRMPRTARLYPAGFAWAGLASCLFLAFQVDRQVWLTGSALLLCGLAWHRLARRRWHRRRGGGGG